MVRTLRIFRSPSLPAGAEESFFATSFSADTWASPGFLDMWRSATDYETVKWSERQFTHWSRGGVSRSSGSACRWEEATCKEKRGIEDSFITQYINPAADGITVAATRGKSRRNILSKCAHSVYGKRKQLLPTFQPVIRSNKKRHLLLERRTFSAQMTRSSQSVEQPETVVRNNWETTLEPNTTREILENGVGLRWKS